MIGETFARLSIMNNEVTVMDSMIITFNAAATETDSEIPGKHCQPESLRKFLTCDKRRELRKKRFEPNRSKK